jgi:hypothetical protein
MFPIRIFLILLFIPAFIVLARSLGSRSRAVRTLLLFTFPSLVGFSILFPGVWQRIADAVGVARGVDLLLYVVVLTLITYIGYSIGKFRHLEQRISVLTKCLALIENESENQPNSK